MKIRGNEAVRLARAAYDNRTPIEIFGKWFVVVAIDYRSERPHWVGDPDESAWAEVEFQQIKPVDASQTAG